MNKSEAISSLLKPLGTLFSAGASVRNQLYDYGWLDIKDCGAPVVSVGNLTTGGTGKTPFTALLAKTLQERGQKTVIVSRGYKSQLENQISRVEIGNLREAAVKFGDEPAMLAHQLKSIPIYIGAERLAVASHAVGEVSPDVVIADDAFQHRRLKRSFDVVLLDATEPWWHFRPLPSGRMREPFSALNRAQAIVLSKANLAEPRRLDRIRDMARTAVDSSRLPIFLEVAYRLHNFTPLKSYLAGDDSQNISAANLANEKLFLLTAIGRPHAFANLVKTETGAQVVGSRWFADHHAFSSGEILSVTQAAERSGAAKIVVTEKDAVKLDPRDFGAIDPLVSRLDALPGENWDEFHARLAGSIR